MALGLYLHIPWCHTRCIYCDFNTYIDRAQELHRAYHRALLREIRMTGAAAGRPRLDTVFFGGGTPTMLAADELSELVAAIYEAFEVVPNAEITTEGNPGTLTVDYLRAIRAGGINRLSLGVQSFNDEELRFLSRLHDADTARRAVGMARTAGFDNLSLDLIFNLPYQNLAQWQNNLRQALALQPNHFSFYSLIVEPNTPLHRMVMRGDVPEPDDDVAADMYDATMAMLAQAGYSHYEISNWARAQGEADTQPPRYASAHNLLYWRTHDYLGLGAGAVGTYQGQRWANVKRPQTYIERINAVEGLGVARDIQTEETLTLEQQLTEYFMMGLRLLREGVSVNNFTARFGFDMRARYASAITHGLERGLLAWATAPTDEHLRLTAAGRFLANEAIVPFFTESSPTVR